MNKKDFICLPNILGYIRLLILPFFAYTYITATTDKQYFVSAVLIGISGVSDFADGFIARKFNMITELGKFLDPFADKVTQGIIIICLMTKFHLLIPVFVLFVIKEVFMMGILGLYIYKKKGNKLGGAKWYGKVCTAIMYLIMAILLVSPVINSFTVKMANILIIICGALLLFSFVNYIPVFIKMWNSNKLVNK